MHYFLCRYSLPRDIIDKGSFNIFKNLNILNKPLSILDFQTTLPIPKFIDKPEQPNLDNILNNKQSINLYYKKTIS